MRKGIMGYKEGGAFTGPDTSTPFVKKESSRQIAIQEAEDSPLQLKNLQGTENLPSVVLQPDDGVIKSTGTGVTNKNTTVVPSVDKSWMTTEFSKDPMSALPVGASLQKLSGKSKGIEVPAEYAAVAALSTAYGAAKLAGATAKGAWTSVYGAGPAGAVNAATAGLTTPTGATSVYGTGVGATAGMVVGGLAAVGGLYDMYKNGVSIENGLATLGGAATFTSAASASGAAWAQGSFASSQALAVAGPLLLGVAAALVIYDALKKPSNKTGIAYGSLSDYTTSITGLEGSNYHQGHRDAAEQLLTPTFDYIKILEEEYDTDIGGNLSVQVGGERGLEIILASEDGRIYVEKGFSGETAVEDMYTWLDTLANFTAQSGVQDIAYGSAILNNEYKYTTGYAQERKNKYTWYQMPGSQGSANTPPEINLDSTRLGLYYGMATDRNAHNAKWAAIDEETRNNIQLWKDHLGDNFVYKEDTYLENITNEDGTYTFTPPNLNKGGYMKKSNLPKFVKNRVKNITTLKEGGTPDSAWGGSSGKIYNSQEPEITPQESQGLLSPRLMATY